MAHLFIIHDQIHQPQSGTLAHGGGLGRLEVGKAQAGHILILVGKLGHTGNGVHQLFLISSRASRMVITSVLSPT